VCGNNAQAKERLERLSTDVPLKVLGYVDNMDELLRASDLAIGKAGPGFIFESIACAVPMILTSHLPGQEAGNAEYACGLGVAEQASGVPQLLDLVAELSTAGSERMESLRQQAHAEATRRPQPDAHRFLLEAIYKAESQTNL
jgi:UDP-N-acetylglucosamine:LPS N-acetylglucosamine transferase